MPPPSLDLILERRLPFFGAVAVSISWFCIGRPFPSPPDNLLGVSATVASVFAGFIGASGAIVLTIKDTRLFKILSEHGYNQDIFSYLRDSLFSATVFATLSLAGYFVEPIHSLGISSLGLYRPLWVFIAFYSLFTFARVSHILFKLLRQTIT